MTKTAIRRTLAGMLPSLALAAATALLLAMPDAPQPTQPDAATRARAADTAGADHAPLELSVLKIADGRD